MPLKPRNYPADVDGARAQESLLQYNNDYMNARLLEYDNLMSITIYGTAINTTFWKQITALVPIPGMRRPDGSQEFREALAYRGPWTENIFVYDAYPDPNKMLIDDDYPMAVVRYRSYDYCERMARRGLYNQQAVNRIGDKIPDELEKVAGDKVYRQDQRAQLGYTNDNALKPDGVLVIEWQGKFRPKLSDPPVQSVIVVANGEVVRAEPSPFVTQESSYTASVMHRPPGQFYGTGVIAKNLPQIHGGNVALNLILTYAAKTVRGNTMVREDLLKFPNDLHNPPGGFHRLKKNADPGLAMNEVQKANLGSDIWNIFGLFADRAARGSGVSNLKVSAGIPGDTTATEISEIQSETAKRFVAPLSMIEQTGLIPRGNKARRLNQQFVDPEFLELVLDQDAVYFPRISAEQLAVDCDIVPQASRRESAKGIVINQLGHAMKMLLPAMQINPPKYGAIYDIFLERAMEEMNLQGLDRARKILTMVNPAAQEQGGGGEGAPGMPNVRRDNRTPEGSNIQQLVKSIGGSLSNAGR